MLQPDLVRQITHAMRRRVSIPVTVKCRLGADDRDSYPELQEFITTVKASGVTHFLIHARKCLLSGLSTTQNRSIPPIKYDWVYNLCNDYPELDFSLNGHVQTLAEARTHLNYHLQDERRTSVLVGNGSSPASIGGEKCNIAPPPRKGLKGVMLGRAAFTTPFILADADRQIFGQRKNPIDTKPQLIEQYLRYCDRVTESEGSSKKLALALVKPLTNLFHGEVGIKHYKACLLHEEIIRKKNFDIRDVLTMSMKHLSNVDRSAFGLDGR
uniref:DUS-like FMN-binding domain-containing protein n=1 Tax=Lotharella globosa TaxID=91324 RepID=A0A7S3YU90_9EUKA